LVAAVGFARTGAEVTVYERSRDAGPIGAGISLFGNGFRALEAVGLADAVRALGSAGVDLPASAHPDGAQQRCSSTPAEPSARTASASPTASRARNPCRTTRSRPDRTGVATPLIDGHLRAGAREAHRCHQPADPGADMPTFMTTPLYPVEPIHL